MSAIVGLGVSEDLGNSFQAGREAAVKALAQMGGEQADFAFLFTTEKFDQMELIKGVKSLLNIPFIGCCGAGVITNEGMFDDSIAIMTVKSNQLRFSNAFVENISQNPRLAGELAAKKVLQGLGDFEQAVFLMLPDGFAANISEVIKGAYNILGPDFHYIGGGSGDNLRFIKTYQFTENHLGSDCLACALIDLKSSMGVAMAHGWTPVGRPMVVTKARDKFIMEIDGKPAFEAYLNCFKNVELTKENFAEFGMKHPLGLPDVTGSYTIRDPLEVLENGAIRCVAEVPENSVVRIMEGDKNSLVKAAENAAREALKMIKGEPAFAIIVECVSRILLLGEDAERELRNIFKIIGRDIPAIGFYSFGEIASYGGRFPAFHNKSIAIWLVG